MVIMSLLIAEGQQQKNKLTIGEKEVDTRIKAIEFDEENHKYWFTDSNGKHRELHGVTGAIGEMMGKSFPDTDTVKLAALYGSDVHKDIENYFNNNGYWFNDSQLSSEGAKWIVEELKAFCDSLFLDKATAIRCEVMVSDFEGTASKVDVVVETREGKAYLFDIKTTSTFDRAYCSLQLSVYKRLFQECYGKDVLAMFVLGTKSKRSYRILEQESVKVRKVLSINRAKTI